MTVDVARLRAGLAAVEVAAAAGRWDQGTWRALADSAEPRCGTVMCMAGLVAEVNGGRWLMDPPVGDVGDDQLLADPSEPGAVCWAAGDLLPEAIWTVNARERARGLLGLSEFGADLLFDGGNSLEELRTVVAMLIAEAEASDEELLAQLEHRGQGGGDVGPESAAGVS
jgi:hypothetical protein